MISICCAGLLRTSLFFLMAVVGSVDRHVLRAAAFERDLLAGLPELAGGGEAGFLVELRVPAPNGLDEETTLFEGGLGLDSFTVVELLAKIEERFDVEFTDDDLKPESFVLKNLATLVMERKQRSPS